MYDESVASPMPPGGEPEWPRPAVSVWATGQHDLDTQLAEGGYATGTAADHSAIPPATAAYAIAGYTRPGAVVLDPDCGAGTVLVEALRAGRNAIGLTTGHRWRMLARANITAAQHRGGTASGMVLRRGAATLGTAHLAGLDAQVDLLLTTVRSHEGADPVDAATATVAHLRALLVGCRPLLRPGAYVVLAARPWRHHGHLVDLPGRVLAAGTAVGLVPEQRCVALSAAVRGDRLVSHAGLAARRSAARQQRVTGCPVCLTAHRDVLVFRARAVEDPAATAPSPHRACPPAPARRAA